MTNPPVPRRRQPWGDVLSGAPWDGRPVPAEPVRMPATVAAPVPLVPQSRRRAAFGALLLAAPWSGPAPAPANDEGRDAAEEDTTLEVPT